MNPVCAAIGHHITPEEARNQQCRCGQRYLHADGMPSKIRHVVSCFVGGHHYRVIAERAGRSECACIRCGHPLLLTPDRVPDARGVLRKRVRYACNLFGHRVQHVAERHGVHEYVCHCGHTFLKHAPHLQVIKHPPICLVAGHTVRFITARARHREYACDHCGHAFCFAI